MNMSNDEKDKFIREALQKDIHVFSSSETLETQIENDINTNTIKLKKYTYGQRRFMWFLVIVLSISLSFNAYFFNNEFDNKQNKNEQIAKNEKDILENIIIEEDKTVENTIIDNTAIENTTINDTNVENANIANPENIYEIAQISPKSDIVDVVIEDKESNKDTYAMDIDEETLKEELANYAISIGRFEGQIDTLEENTVALLMAHNNFSNKKMQVTDTKSSLKYALTAENVHLFLTELTGTKIDKFLNSYANYIGYTELSKAYVLGKNGNVLRNESYEVLELKFENKNNSNYKFSGTIQKTIDGNKIIYEYVVAISIHEKYTYNKYKINSFTAKLKDGHKDNVVRLVDYVEEQQTETKTKKK